MRISDWSSDVCSSDLVLEGVTPTAQTQSHLDRCLTCRNCETTCPSGVQYGALVDIGRNLVDRKVKRPPGQRMMRWLLRTTLTSRWFGPAFRLGRLVRPILPDVLPLGRAACRAQVCMYG